jgi:hypothetical protein
MELQDSKTQVDLLNYLLYSAYNFLGALLVLSHLLLPVTIWCRYYYHWLNFIDIRKLSTRKWPNCLWPCDNKNYSQDMNCFCLASVWWPPLDRHLGHGEYIIHYNYYCYSYKIGERKIERELISAIWWNILELTGQTESLQLPCSCM